MRKNPQKHMAIACGAAACVAMAGAILPLALGVDALAGGFALALAGGVFAILCLGGCFVFAARSRLLSNLLDGGEVLARWEIPDAAWELHASGQGEPAGGGRSGGLLALTAVEIVLGGFVWLAAPGVGRVAAAGFWCLALASGVAAALAPRVVRARQSAGPREAAMSHEGAFVAGTLHAWGGLGARVEEVEVAGARSLCLRVLYSVPALFGRREIEAAIPVPPGQESLAAAVGRALVGRMADREER